MVCKSGEWRAGRWCSLGQYLLSCHATGICVTCESRKIIVLSWRVRRCGRRGLRAIRGNGLNNLVSEERFRRASCNRLLCELLFHVLGCWEVVETSKL